MQTSLFNSDAFNSGAVFSPCRVWRYQLWRIWDKSKPALNVIGLNPSTADEQKNDPTIRRCINFAKSWNYGGLLMTNAFAFRATLPKDMRKAEDPIGPDNDRWLKETAASAGLVVAAWGVNGRFRERDKAICAMIPGLHCFRLSQKTRMPEHPLYLPGDLRPVIYQVRSQNE